jgi:putative lysine transport system permease protein
MNSFERIGYLLENFFSTFLDGIAATLILAIVGTGVGLLIGILVALGRNIKIKDTDNLWNKIWKRTIKVITTIYVQVFRGTPMMVQAMIIYFGFSGMGFSWSAIQLGWIFNGYMICGLIVITINTGAYMSEIIRSGLNGIDLGQEEASRSLGMSYWKTMFLVIMPQAIKNSIPTILNEYIVNVKDSSVLNVIGLTELYASVSIATNRNYFKVEGYIIIAVIYLALTLLATLIVKLISKKLNGEKIFVNPFKHAKVEVASDGK